MNFRATTVLRAVGTVVVQADHFNVAFLAKPTSMVLETKFGVIRHIKVGLFAVQSPNNAAVCAVDLVDCACVTSRDQVVAFGILVDAVDVEVVPSV